MLLYFFRKSTSGCCQLSFFSVVLHTLRTKNNWVCEKNFSSSDIIVIWNKWDFWKIDKVFYKRASFIILATSNEVSISLKRLDKSSTFSRIWAILEKKARNQQHWRKNRHNLSGKCDVFEKQWENVKLLAKIILIKSGIWMELHLGKRIKPEKLPYWPSLHYEVLTNRQAWEIFFSSLPFNDNLPNAVFWKNCRYQLLWRTRNVGNFYNEPRALTPAESRTSWSLAAPNKIESLCYFSNHLKLGHFLT